MPVLSIDELKALVETAQSPCVSIYMPAQKAGPEVRQNPIRFKNLIREAENRLEAMGMEGGEAAEFLKSAHELDTVEFWENQDRGLVILLSPGEFRLLSTSLRISRISCCQRSLPPQAATASN